MKERERSAIILFRESALGENVCRRPGEIALRKIIQDRLKIASRGARFVERAIRLAKEEECIGATRSKAAEEIARAPGADGGEAIGRRNILSGK